jgi:hypothetical protein
LSKHFRGPLAAGLPYSEPRIKAAWRVVHSGQEEFEKAGGIDPEHLEVMRRIQLDMAMHLAKVEDGHAILYTEWSTRRSRPQREVTGRLRLKNANHRCDL